MSTKPFRPDESFAKELDANDEVRRYREQFHIPPRRLGGDSIYLCGNSLGLQPKRTRAFIEQELKDWETLAVEGHFHARHPWMPYHEYLTDQTARLVGARPPEVINMNSLTANLHFLMASFYRPTPLRHKILIEDHAFPSDQYAVTSQIRFHGYDPGTSLIQPHSSSAVIPTEAMEDLIQEEGPSIALILLGGVNYYSGQAFDMARIARAGHAQGCVVGFDLAHAAGNVYLQLHDWNVDFAAWCSYKYLNAGPGGIAGCFIHERHVQDPSRPRLAGWWGHDKTTRFLMGPTFSPMNTAEGWQVSNPPIFQLAALRASLDIFDEAGMPRLRAKSERLTGYMEFLLDEWCDGHVECITPRDPSARGCQLSLRVRGGKGIHQRLTDAGIVCDWREPDVIRVAPVPLYNSFMDVFHFVRILADILAKD